MSIRSRSSASADSAFGGYKYISISPKNKCWDTPHPFVLHPLILPVSFPDKNKYCGSDLSVRSQLLIFYSACFIVLCTHQQSLTNADHPDEAAKVTLITAKKLLNEYNFVAWKFLINLKRTNFTRTKLAIRTKNVKQREYCTWSRKQIRSITTLNDARGKETNSVFFHVSVCVGLHVLHMRNSRLDIHNQKSYGEKSTFLQLISAYKRKKSGAHLQFFPCPSNSATIERNSNFAYIVAPLLGYGNIRDRHDRQISREGKPHCIFWLARTSMLHNLSVFGEWFS
jgi:hypothetical protein